MVQGADGADPRAAIFHEVVARGWVLLALEQERATLEDVFIRLTTREEAREMAEPGSGGEERLVVPEPADVDTEAAAGTDEEVTR
jgi:hypothetical protein